MVKRLIEVIRDDKSITDDELFQVGQNGYKVNKKALTKLTEISLPDFLLSVWAFVVLKRNDNSVGKETIAAWSDPKTKGRYIGIDGSSITQDINVTMPPVEQAEKITADITEDDEDAEYDEPPIDESAPDPTPNVTNQIINAPAVFFNSGANVMQINNTGTINFDRSGKS